MTRKDYVLIAEALKMSQHNAYGDPDHPIHLQWRNTRECIADMLQNDNPNFDRERFYAATERKGQKR